MRACKLGLLSIQYGWFAFGIDASLLHITTFRLVLMFLDAFATPIDLLHEISSRNTEIQAYGIEYPL